MTDQKDNAQAVGPQDQDILQQAQKAAHSLNNRLGIIRGNLEMLGMEVAFDEKAERRLERIYTAIDDASQIVTSLHAQTRLEAATLAEKAKVAEKASIREAINVTRPDNNSDAPKSHHNILIVDDEVDLVEVVMRQLEFRGFKVYAATSAEEAIEILEQQAHIDLLFTDVVMNNGMNGFQLAHHVHRQYPHIRILLTTGHTQKLEKSQEFRDEFIYRLMQAKLPKPYTHQDLVNAIQVLL